MRDILKRVFIGVAIGMALFFIKTQVFAASVSISSADFQYSTHLCDSLEHNCDNFYVSGYSSNGTWKSLTSQPGSLPIQRYFYVNSYARAYASLNTSNVYTFTFRQQFDPKNQAILQTVDAWRYDLYGYNSNGLSDTYFSSQSCSTRNVPTHTYAVETTCTFTLNTSVSYVLVRTAFLLTPTGSRFTISNAQMQSSQNEIGAINENTATLKTQFQQLYSKILSQTEELLDADADASNVYNNDYSNPEWEDAEDNLDSYVDIDLSDLAFDPTQWINGFTYFWSLCTSFVQLNAKVFATITAFLTFSLVGLVLGR